LHRVVIQDLDKGVVAAGEKRGGQHAGLDEIPAAVGGHHDTEAAITAWSSAKASAAPWTRAEAKRVFQHEQGVVVEGLDKRILAIVEDGRGQHAGLDIISAAVGGDHDAEAAAAARPRPKAAAANGTGPELIDEVREILTQHGGRVAVQGLDKSV